MEFFETALLFVHIVAGFGSLVLFWVPVWTRKGGINHRRVGRWYVRSMSVVVISAILLSLINLYRGNIGLGVFLGFLALLTAKALWLATSILKNKRDVGLRYRLKLIAFSGLVVGTGIALIAYGIALGGKGLAVYMFIFGGLGLSGIFELISLIRGSFEQEDWIKHHIVGMGGSGIAAHTAFMSFGGSSLITGFFNSYWALVPWMAPTVIGIIAINVAVKKTVGKEHEKEFVVPRSE